MCWRRRHWYGGILVICVQKVCVCARVFMTVSIHMPCFQDRSTYNHIITSSS